MKRIIQTGYGDPARVLQLVEREQPVPTAEQVLVRVIASSVNSGDWRQVLGRPLLGRPMMGGLRRPKDPVVGGDAAGVVEAVGSEVSHVKPGDEVFGMRNGAFAEFVAGRTFVAKPANLSFDEAAAVPIAALTALQAVRNHGAVAAGQKVLINGAGGGVGSFAVQIAKAFGAEVTAVTSTANLEMVAGIGADHVIDYTRQDFSRGSERYDALIDTGGTPSLSAFRRAAKPDGTIVIVGAGKGLPGPFGRFTAGAIRRRLGQRVIGFLAQPNREDMLTLKELIEAGKLRPVIERSYGFDEIAAALSHAATERVRGKLVISIAK